MGWHPFLCGSVISTSILMRLVFHGFVIVILLRLLSYDCLPYAQLSALIIQYSLSLWDRLSWVLLAIQWVYFILYINAWTAWLSVRACGTSLLLHVLRLPLVHFCVLFYNSINFCAIQFPGIPTLLLVKFISLYPNPPLVILQNMATAPNRDLCTDYWR